MAAMVGQLKPYAHAACMCTEASHVWWDTRWSVAPGDSLEWRRQETHGGPCIPVAGGEKMLSAISCFLTVGFFCILKGCEPWMSMDGSKVPSSSLCPQNLCDSASVLRTNALVSFGRWDALIHYQQNESLALCCTVSRWTVHASCGVLWSHY